MYVCTFWFVANCLYSRVFFGFCCCCLVTTTRFSDFFPLFSISFFSQVLFFLPPIVFSNPLVSFCFNHFLSLSLSLTASGFEAIFFSFLIETKQDQKQKRQNFHHIFKFFFSSLFLSLYLAQFIHLIKINVFIFL